MKKKKTGLDIAVIVLGCLFAVLIISTCVFFGLCGHYASVENQEKSKQMATIVVLLLMVAIPVGVALLIVGIINIVVKVKAGKTMQLNNVCQPIQGQACQNDDLKLADSLVESKNDDGSLFTFEADYDFKVKTIMKGVFSVYSSLFIALVICLCVGIGMLVFFYLSKESYLYFKILFYILCIFILFYILFVYIFYPIILQSRFKKNKTKDIYKLYDDRLTVSIQNETVDNIVNLSASLVIPFANTRTMAKLDAFTYVFFTVVNKRRTIIFVKLRQDVDPAIPAFIDGKIKEHSK